MSETATAPQPVPAQAAVVSAAPETKIEATAASDNASSSVQDVETTAPLKEAGPTALKDPEPSAASEQLTATETQLEAATTTKPEAITAAPGATMPKETGSEATTTASAVPAPNTAEIPGLVASENKPAPDLEKKEVQEPQNTLTKQFTDAEWTALKEFRVSTKL